MNSENNLKPAIYFLHSTEGSDEQQDKTPEPKATIDLNNIDYSKPVPAGYRYAITFGDNAPKDEGQDANAVPVPEMTAPMTSLPHCQQNGEFSLPAQMPQETNAVPQTSIQPIRENESIFKDLIISSGKECSVSFPVLDRGPSVNSNECGQPAPTVTGMAVARFDSPAVINPYYSIPNIEYAMPSYGGYPMPGSSVELNRMRMQQKNREETKYQLSTINEKGTPQKIQGNLCGDHVVAPLTEGKDFNVIKIEDFEKGMFYQIEFTDGTGTRRSFEVNDIRSKQALLDTFKMNGGKIYTEKEREDFFTIIAQLTDKNEPIRRFRPGWAHDKDGGCIFSFGDACYRFLPTDVLFRDTDCEDTDGFMRMLVNAASYLFRRRNLHFSKSFAACGLQTDILLKPDNMEKKLNENRFRRYVVINDTTDDSSNWYFRNKKIDTIRGMSSELLIYLADDRGKNVDHRITLPLFGKESAENDCSYRLTAGQYIDHIRKYAEDFDTCYDTNFKAASEQYADHPECETLSTLFAVGFSLAWVIDSDNHDLAEKARTATGKTVDAYAGYWKEPTGEEIVMELRKRIEAGQKSGNITVCARNKAPDYNPGKYIVYDPKRKEIYIHKDLLDKLLTENRFGTIKNFEQRLKDYQVFRDEKITINGKEVRVKVFLWDLLDLDSCMKTEPQKEVDFSNLIKISDDGTFIDPDFAESKSLSMLFLGKTGCGKSVEIQRILLELVKKIGARIICLDFSGSFHESAIFGPFQKDFSAVVKRLNPIQEPLPCRIFDRRMVDGKVSESDDSAAEALCRPIQTFIDFGDLQKNVLKNAAADMIKDGSFRTNGIIALEEKLEKKLEEEKKKDNQETIGNTLEKLSGLLGVNFIKEGEPIWKGKQISVIDLSGFSKQCRQIVCEIFLEAIMRDTEIQNPIPTFVVLEEIQNIHIEENGNLYRIMTEWRKRNLHVILSTQSFAAAKNTAQKSLLEMAEYKFLFSAKTSQDLENCSSLVNPTDRKPAKQKLHSLKKYQCVVLGEIISDGEVHENTDGTVVSLGYGKNGENK